VVLALDFNVQLEMVKDGNDLLNGLTGPGIQNNLNNQALSSILLLPGKKIGTMDIVKVRTCLYHNPGVLRV
jgi:hypothetical protein